MKKIAVAAVMLGVMSPMALAEVSGDGPTQDGLSLGDLNKIVKELEIRQENGNLIITGLLPKRCVEGFDVSYRAEENKHLITVRSPHCDSSFTKADDEKYVDLANIISDKQLDPAVTGQVYLRHYPAVSAKSRNRERLEALTDGGKPITVVGTDTLDRKRIADEALAADREKNRELDELSKRVSILCKQNDYVGVGEEIMKAGKLLGDVAGFLDGLSNNQKIALLKAIDKAETSEEAKEAYDAFVAAAGENGWDEDEAKKPYLEKRFDLASNMVDDAKSGDSKLREADKELESLKRDLRAMDRKAYREKKSDLARMFAELGTQAANSKKMNEAERYLDKAKRLSDDVDSQIKIDGALAKMYADQLKECVKKNPMKAESCERKYMSKVKERSENISDALKNKDGEDSQEELAAFQGEYISTFGGGMAANVPGLGQFTQMPGSYQQFKMQSLQEYQVQQQQMMMQRMMGGGMQQASATTSIFR